MKMIVGSKLQLKQTILSYETNLKKNKIKYKIKK